MADVLVERENRSSFGPVVAVIALIVVAFLAYMAWQYFGGMAPTSTNDTTDINVTTPAPSTNTTPTNQ